MPLLELHDVSARYGPITALHGLSLQVEEGTIVAILGANGAGKTTTLRAISGLVRKSGEIVFAGRRIGGWAAERTARSGIAHVPDWTARATRCSGSPRSSRSTPSPAGSW